MATFSKMAASSTLHCSAHLIDAHALHPQQQIVRGPAADVRRILRRTLVLEHGTAVEPVRVAGGHSARPPGALLGARLRRPHDAPCACAGRVVVHSVGEKKREKKGRKKQIFECHKNRYLHKKAL